MGHDLTRKIIVVSYSGELARKLSRDLRAVVESAWYRRYFPDMVRSKNSEIEITMSQNGYRYPTSTGGTATGRGAGNLVLDDPIVCNARAKFVQQLLFAVAPLSMITSSTETETSDVQSHHQNADSRLHRDPSLGRGGDNQPLFP